MNWKPSLQGIWSKGNMDALPISKTKVQIDCNQQTNGGFLTSQISTPARPIHDDSRNKNNFFYDESWWNLRTSLTVTGRILTLENFLLPCPTFHVTWRTHSLTKASTGDPVSHPAVPPRRWWTVLKERQSESRVSWRENSKARAAWRTDLFLFTSEEHIF